MPTNVDSFRNRLREHVQRHGLKTSSRRDLILETLASANRHITAEELLRAVRTKDPRVGAATVYRTLRVLQESGIVAERHFEGGATRYELIGDHHHDHLICTQCKTIVEFEDDQIEAEQDRIAQTHGFELHSHRHELYGLCSRCRRRKSRD
jgi:Fur family ferric uptake transcriptional regulator